MRSAMSITVSVNAKTDLLGLRATNVLPDIITTRFVKLVRASKATPQRRYVLLISRRIVYDDVIVA